VKRVWEVEKLKDLDLEALEACVYRLEDRIGELERRITVLEAKTIGGMG
jgi:vacuolar-type H+-ATPase subunit D/Vma8